MIEGKDRGLGLVSPSNCSNPESCFAAFCVCCVCIQNQSFHNFKNYTLKLSVNKEKLTDLCAGNSSNIQQVLT